MFEGLGKFWFVFVVKGFVIVGNVLFFLDGVVVVVVMSKEKADELGFKLLVYYCGFQVGGVVFEVMGIGFIAVFFKLFEKIGVKFEEIDLIELNEVFVV